MHPFTIQLDDRAVAFAREGHVLSSAPSAVWDGSTGEPAGTNAWNALRRHPTATSTRHLGTLLSQRSTSDRTVALVAAELVRRLAAQPPRPDERIWMATPGRTSAEGLSAMLAIARHLSLPVDGFIDAAVASVAALGLERSSIVLEIGMHDAAATYIDRDGTQVRRRRTAVTQRGGLITFYQGWLELVSTTMVKRTRFDPLHDAATEQNLFDSLATWARTAATTGAVSAVLSKGAERFEVALTCDQFAQAGQGSHREIVRLLHELRPAGAPITLVVPSMIDQLPGLADELEQFIDCELIGIPDGFAAVVTSRLELPERSSTDPVRLLRRLPVITAGQQVNVGEIKRNTLRSQNARTTAPSHLLFDGKVYALTVEPLVIGRSPAGPRTISLPDGLAGVSRRHCTLAAQGGEVVLLDHSNFGTYVNGERVAERVRLLAGDRVRVGDPGVEFSLIAVDEASSGVRAQK
jgi:FHA domain-containing protein